MSLIQRYKDDKLFAQDDRLFFGANHALDSDQFQLDGAGDPGFAGSG